MFKRIIGNCRPIINTRRIMIGARPSVFLRSLACAHPPLRYFSSGTKSSDNAKSKEETKSSNGGLTSTKIPEEFPIVPLITVRKSPMFPGFVRIIDISNKKVIELVKRKMSLDLPYVGVFMLREDDFAGKQVTLKDIYSVGSFCNIVECHEHGSSLRIFVISHRRINLLEPLPEDAASVIKGLKLKNGKRAMKNGVPESGKIPVDHANIVMLKTENLLHQEFEKSLETKAMMEEIVQTVREISQLNPIYREAVSQLLQGGFKMDRSLQDPIYVSDIGAALVNAESIELQTVLEETHIPFRLRLTLELLKKELALVQLQQKIRIEVEEKVKEQNRTYMLNEQLKAIKRELGILKDDKDSISEKFRQRLENLIVPTAVMEVIEQELTKLANLESFSAEFSVTRNYLDWLTLIPWGKYTEDSLDLVKAREILDHDHYGMKDAKDRILEFIAVSILKKSTHGKILCFHGPPGVGKTSIGRSIARALNREYYRFSVGGLTDVAEIKGHRRTYVGAMPGKLVQCLKKANSQNPVVLIDEIDKIGKGYQGDPASALLEVLDPQQNYSFTDHYMDVPLDLSKLLFICTANDISTIPPPLRDRMDLISLSGYTDDEKKHIAQNHLIPLISDTTGLVSEQLTIGESALDTLIRSYTRESGVRNLNQLIERIYRKAALNIILNDSAEKDLTSEGLIDLIGPVKYPENTFYGTKTPIGVTTGLAWTSVGGVVLYVECRTREEGGSGNLLLTGNMGDVMKESTDIALTVAQSLLKEKYPGNDFLGLKKGRLHLHIPEGATPKDGPSAGCTLATAMLSAALGRPTKQPIAMTGELSLTGCVLPVGGIKEKVLAARRVGINELILPMGNESDFLQLDESIKSSFQIHYVTEYSQIFDLVFGHFDP